jgi:hypothetical protein
MRVLLHNLPDDHLRDGRDQPAPLLQNWMYGPLCPGDHCRVASLPVRTLGAMILHHWTAFSFAWASVPTAGLRYRIVEAKSLCPE